LQLTSNGDVTVRTPGDGDLMSVIYALYGRQTAEAMVPLKHTRDGIEVTGYVGRPAIARGNRARQTFLLNGRVIRSAKLNAALDEGYRTMLMTRQYAVAVVVLQVDPARVDVNVHPAKLEVRFSDEAMVFGAVHGAVKNALLQLSTGGLAPADGFAPTAKAAPAGMPGQPVLPHQTTAPAQLRAPVTPSGPARPGASDTAGATGTTGTTGTAGATDVVEEPLATGRPGTAEAPRDPFHATHAASAEVSHEAFRATHPTSADGSWEHGAGIAPLPEMPRAEQQRLVPEAPSLPPQSADPSAMQPPVDPSVMQPSVDAAVELGGQTPRHPVFLEMRLVGQVFESFLVLEHGEEMLLLDQHAAHERIRFEDLRWGLRHGDTPSQPFLQPVVLQLSAMEYEQALPVLPSLARIGFAIEAFGGNTLLVRAIPATFDGGLSESELSAIVIDGISDTGSRQGAVSEETLHLISCKGAIKANRALSTQEARALLERLSGLENPYHCVHGRPILLRFPRHELEKRFKRIV
jgi:DNA mismatch repair protein MutL